MDVMLERILECIGPKHGSKKELAEFLDIHPNVITNWLNGRNKSYRKYLPQISEHYNVSIEYLKGETDQKEKPAGESTDGLSDYEVRMLAWFRSLPPEKRKAILEIGDGPKE